MSRRLEKRPEDLIFSEEKKTPIGQGLFAQRHYSKFGTFELITDGRWVESWYKLTGEEAQRERKPRSSFFK